MSKWKKILRNILCGVLAFGLLCTVLFYTIRPGVPVDKITENGETISGLQLPNGEYTGKSVLGLLHGKGVFYFDTGEIYEGNWDFHNMSGNGTLTTTMGVYEGQFKESKRDGEGMFTWTDGTQYIGTWVNDKMCGEGEIKTPDKLLYKGTFVDSSLQEGSVEGNTDAFSFSINITDGVLDSKISVTFTSGVTYQGEYSEQYFSGEGIMTFPSVGKYEGEFKTGIRSGYGEFTWTDGVAYKGNWENDVFEGQGVYYFDANTSISGEFDHGQLNGTYTYKNSNGTFNTVWADGKCTSVTVY